MAFLFLDKKNITFGVIILSFMLILGVIIGYYGRGSPSPTENMAKGKHCVYTKREFTWAML